MNEFNSLYLNNLFLPIIIIWSLFWKGFALWIAAKNDHSKWFVALLIINIFGILEIFYIFYIAKKNYNDIKEILTKTILFKKKE